MKYIIIYILTIFIMHDVSLTQVKPYLEPLSISTGIVSLKKNINTNDYIETIFPDNYRVSQIEIELPFKENCNFLIKLDNMKDDDKIFIINKSNKHFIGPYTKKDILDENIKTDFINAKEVIIELNSDYEIINKNIAITTNPKKKAKSLIKKQINSKKRDEPVIVLTGYWPPTNEMIRHFSQDMNLNPNGWQGDDWENRGYNIISFFPTFNPPDCSSCGQGSGVFEVDYQDTSEDFWPLLNNIEPIAVITFSRGYIDLSWEMEYNAYNRTNWYNDFSSPFLPTPNPPDEEENAYFLRNSNLPMENIVEAIDELDLNLSPYIDENGDPGHYVSEFMAYHGTWYRDLNDWGENNCISAGHIHVGGNIDWDTARIATEETLRVLINHLDQFVYTPGDVNQDDVIDILDLVLILNNILGSHELTQNEYYASDINEDGIINIQDIIIIINLILNNI